MSLGLKIFTAFHVLLSLIGIGSGFVVAFAMARKKDSPSWTSTFLVTTILTSVTGFLFPYHGFLPSHALGIISLFVLAIAVYALYIRRLSGGWRQTYSVTAVIALYLNVFVLIAQLFRKVPALSALAPTQSEPPFKVVQLVVLLSFMFLGVFAVRGYSRHQISTT
jgi:hypothetical protein